MSQENLLLLGQSELPPKPLTLRAGPLTMLFEPDNAFLRYVRLGDHEVVRNIYAVVRDQNWNTIAWRVSNLQSEVRPDSFDLTFDVECREREVDYVWKGTVRGDAGGQVSFRFEGEARSNFQRNRIGICVLHPVTECAGKPVVLEHNDGNVEHTAFPKPIAPWQPLRDVRTLTQEIAPGVSVAIRFEGEVFETEDQRNYGDASFKTYSTPQDLPKPVAVKPGDRVNHLVTISLINPAGKKVLPVNQGRPAQLSIHTTPVLPKPALGVRLAKHQQPLTEREATRLRALGLSHLRADVTMAGDWREELRLATAQSAQLQLPLHLAVHLGTDPAVELARLSEEIASTRPKVGAWIVYQQGQGNAPSAVVEQARQALSGHDSKAVFAAGATPFFTEFNRNRPEASAAALPCYPQTPQVHLKDPLTIIENAADVSETVESAKAILPPQVIISPITLKPWHKVRGGDDLASGQLPGDVDPRQMSLFGAAWTVVHLSRLALNAHVHSATYFETTGWRGLMETEAGSPLPEKFPSLAGGVFPLYHVFAALAGFTRVLPTQSTLPLQVEGLTLLDAQNRRRVLVANLLPEPQEIKIKTGTGEARMWRLNTATARSAMTDPEAFMAAPGEALTAVAGKMELQLAPYEVVRLDVL